MLRLGRRLRRLDPTLIALGSAIVLMAGVLAFALSEGDAARPGAAAPASAPAAGAPLPAPVKIAERTEAARTEERRAKSGDDLSAEPPFTVPAPLRSVDGTTFRRGDDIIHVHGVEGPGPDAVCAAEEGQGRWACGLQARAALHNIAGGKSLYCQPRQTRGPGEMTADCTVPQEKGKPQHLGMLLVAAGWARPKPGEDDFGPAMEQARERRAGLWRGGWTIVADPRQASP